MEDRKNYILLKLFQNNNSSYVYFLIRTPILLLMYIRTLVVVKKYLKHFKTINKLSLIYFILSFSPCFLLLLLKKGTEKIIWEKTQITSICIEKQSSN